jgi:Ca2+-binding EF-hand superfamily protein
MASKESKVIAPPELEETLISLGLAKTREDVENALKKFDLNLEGALDFDQFIEILKELAKDYTNNNFL